MAQAHLHDISGVDRPVLVCDLDGTLIRTDLLDESFWAALASRWTAPFAAFAGLLRGRAALKSVLAQRGDVDVRHLPYREDILARLRDWRAQGGKVALVTAADRHLAERVAAHLDLFDEVHGSDGGVNLKGGVKAAFLIDRYGAGGFHYIGDSEADLPVWAASSGAVTVGAPPSLRRRVRAEGGVEHLDTDLPSFPRALMRALRPHQWAKNILIFLPLLAAHRMDAPGLSQAVLAFIAFGLLASSVYVINDLLDLPSDRAHPRKRARPFASGQLALRHGLWLTPFLLVAGFGLGALLGPGFVAVLLAYYLTTTAYSMWLKQVPVLDICTLAGLYTLRIVAGAVATSTPLSVWLLAFSIFFFFSLAAVKRQAELVDAVAADRALNARRGYRAEDLPLVAMMAVGAGYVSVLVMALYVNSPEVTDLYARPEVLFGICAILLFWISRIVLITHRGKMHDDPVVFAAEDKVSYAAFGLVFLLVVAGAQL